MQNYNMFTLIFVTFWDHATRSKFKFVAGQKYDATFFVNIKTSFFSQLVVYQPPRKKLGKLKS